MTPCCSDIPRCRTLWTLLARLHWLHATKPDFLKPNELRELRLTRAYIAQRQRGGRGRGGLLPRKPALSPYTQTGLKETLLSMKANGSRIWCGRLTLEGKGFDRVKVSYHCHEENSSWKEPLMKMFFLTSPDLCERHIMHISNWVGPWSG